MEVFESYTQSVWITLQVPNTSARPATVASASAMVGASADVTFLGGAAVLTYKLIVVSSIGIG